MLMMKDDFLLRHYDSGDCQGKLGHSRASVIWHRAQVPSHRDDHEVEQDRDNVMLTGDRDLCWIWDSTCPCLPSPSCCRTLHHLLQVQVKSISTSFPALHETFSFFCSVKPIFSNSSKIITWQDTEIYHYQLSYPVKLIWVCWKLVELGKTLLILPLSFQKVWFVRWHCWVQGFGQVEVDLRERL